MARAKAFEKAFYLLACIFRRDVEQRGHVRLRKQRVGGKCGDRRQPSVPARSLANLVEARPKSLGKPLRQGLGIVVDSLRVVKPHLVITHHRVCRRRQLKIVKCAEGYGYQSRERPLVTIESDVVDPPNALLLIRLQDGGGEELHAPSFSYAVPADKNVHVRRRNGLRTNRERQRRGFQGQALGIFRLWKLVSKLECGKGGVPVGQPAEPVPYLGFRNVAQERFRHHFLVKVAVEYRHLECAVSQRRKHRRSDRVAEKVQCLVVGLVLTDRKKMILAAIRTRREARAFGFQDQKSSRVEVLSARSLRSLCDALRPRGQRRKPRTGFGIFSNRPSSQHGDSNTRGLSGI